MSHYELSTSEEQNFTGKWICYSMKSNMIRLCTVHIYYNGRGHQALHRKSEDNDTLAISVETGIVPVSTVVLNNYYTVNRCSSYFPVEIIFDSLECVAVCSLTKYTPEVLVIQDA
jgi:hypothetical protein